MPNVGSVVLNALHRGMSVARRQGQRVRWRAMPSRCEAQLNGASNQAHLKKGAKRIDPYGVQVFLTWKMASPATMPQTTDK